MRKTKIICTIGPASNSEETLEKMLKAGMNVARINFSHGTREGHGETIDRFRKVRDKLKMAAAVLLDTKGPEIRVKNFLNGREMLKEGEQFTITTREVEGTKDIVSVSYNNFPKELHKDNLILINDGKIVLKVLEIKDEDVICTVIHGGEISNHKGINLPNVNLNMEYISPQDREDILYGIKKDVDYIAASFVRTKEDVEAIRSILRENGGEKIKIISKIESTQGVANFEEILEASDGIMIARGDMGVEVAFELLPGIQKRFISRCVQAGKIVITATQMLESMIESPMPTRAEINDVANAVFDGTTGVMLSGESAAGKYPVEAVAAMAKIASQAELDMLSSKHIGAEHTKHDMDIMDVTNAVGHAACTLAHDIKAGAIMAVTKTGYTAGRMSKFRPEEIIVGATPYEKSYHQMSLMWGVAPIIVHYREDIDELFGHFMREAIRKDLVKEGDKIVISAGLPVDVKGNTNMIRVMTATLEK